MTTSLRSGMWLGLPVVLAGTALLLAGPLDPPAGPVAPTHKTLTEVEPRIAINATTTPGDANSLFKITQPGSYYLTGNLAGVVGKHGIEVAASGVTIDMGGFDMVGAVGAGLFDGVSVTGAGLTDIEVHNGSIRNFTGDGVDLGTLSAGACRLTTIRVSGNGGYGMSGGTSCVIRECAASDNALSGIRADDNSSLQICVSAHNGGAGFLLSIGCTVSQCSAQSNTGAGISTGLGCGVIGCTTASNSGAGILTSHGCTVSGCTAYSNTSIGVSTGWRSTVVDCTVANNGADGIATGSGCTIRGCSAYDNTNGIVSGSSCTISGNTVANQSLDGIRVTGHCVVSGNTCSFNGAGATIGAGVHTTGDGNRVEANACNGNDFGIDIDGTGNIVIRNSCASNTQAFVIVSDNLYGPIIDRRIPTTVPSTPPAVGFSAAGTMGTTDTNANVAH